MTEKMLRALEAALKAGHKVQLKMKDGEIKMQVVFLKELKCK